MLLHSTLENKIQFSFLLRRMCLLMKLSFQRMFFFFVQSRLANCKNISLVNLQRRRKREEKNLFSCHGSFASKNAKMISTSIHSFIHFFKAIFAEVLFDVFLFFVVINARYLNNISLYLCVF